MNLIIEAGMADSAGRDECNPATQDSAICLT